MSRYKLSNSPFGFGKEESSMSIFFDSKGMLEDKELSLFNCSNSLFFANMYFFQRSLLYFVVEKSKLFPILLKKK